MAVPPDVGLYVSTGQGVHGRVSVVDEAVPGGHGMQLSSAKFGVEPDGHTVVIAQSRLSYKQKERGESPPTPAAIWLPLSLFTVYESP